MQSKARCQVLEGIAAFTVVLLLTSTGIIGRYGQPHLDMDDPELAAEIAAQIQGPSSSKYNLEHGKPDWGQMEQVRFIQALTRNKTGGVFLESGAYDGEIMSNSLLLEQLFGWRGLLVEPSTRLWERLQKKNRHCQALHACLSQTDHSYQAIFRDQMEIGVNTIEDGFVSQRVADIYTKALAPMRKIRRHKIPCYPLYSILLAANLTTIDLFSLDIEGMEMGVLAHVPWDKVDIKILLVEFLLADIWNPQTDLMRSFMEERGYLSLRLQNDWLFVRKDTEYARNAPQIVSELRTKLATEQQLRLALTGEEQTIFDVYK